MKNIWKKNNAIFCKRANLIQNRNVHRQIARVKRKTRETFQKKGNGVKKLPRPLFIACFFFHLFCFCKMCTIVSEVTSSRSRFCLCKMCTIVFLSLRSVSEVTCLRSRPFLFLKNLHYRLSIVKKWLRSDFYRTEVTKRGFLDDRP